MSWVPFNINDRIRITLTEHGRAALVAYWLQSHPRSISRAEQAADTCNIGWRSGSTVMQLWQAMQIFGPHTSLGGPNLFETAIEIELPELPGQPEALALSSQQEPNNQELLTALKDARDVLQSCANDTMGTRSQPFFESKAKYCDIVIAKAEGRNA